MRMSDLNPSDSDLADFDVEVQRKEYLSLLDDEFQKTEFDAILQLQKNPDDQAARQRLARARHWRERQSKQRDPLALVINPEPKKYGNWTRTAKGWLLRVSKAVVGDVVLVRKKNAATERWKLKECVANNLFRGTKED